MNTFTTIIAPPRSAGLAQRVGQDAPRIPLARHLVLCLIWALVVACCLAAVPSAQASPTCKGLPYTCACGICFDPPHGYCREQDSCSCYSGWAGTGCQSMAYCGSLTCTDCNTPFGMCDTGGGPTGKCICAAGRTGACCEMFVGSGGSGAVLAPASLDFGSVAVGAPAPTTLTFSNQGTTALTIDSLTLGGANSADFAITGGSCAPDAVVATGATCSVSVAFTPSAPGPRSASLAVVNKAVTLPSGSSKHFDSLVDVPLATLFESNAVTIGSFYIIDSPENHFVDGGTALIYESGAWGSPVTLFTSGGITDTRLIKLQLTSSASGNTQTLASIYATGSGIKNTFIRFSVRTIDDQAMNATLSGIGTIVASSVVIDPATPATLYTGLDGGGIYKSLDSGATWTMTNITPANTRVKAVVIKPGDITTLYAATYGNGVYLSTNSGAPANNGMNWTVCANTNLLNKNVVSLTIDASGKLYAGTEAGVFVSEDGCATWTGINTGLPN